MEIILLCILFCRSEHTLWKLMFVCMSIRLSLSLSACRPVYFPSVHSSIYPSVCLSAHLCVSLFVCRPAVRLSFGCLSFCLSSGLSIYPSVRSSIYPSVCLSARLFVSLFVCRPAVDLFFCLSARIFVCLSVRLFIHLSVSLFVCRPAVYQHVRLSVREGLGEV